VSSEAPPESSWSAVIAETRSALAAGESPNRDALAARIRSVAPPDEADGALVQLDRVLAVGRARARLVREPAPPAPVARPLRSALKTRPTLTANMDVRRRLDGGTHSLAWDAAPAVAEWEVRIAERADARSEYAGGETRTLPGTAVSVELPLSDRALRVHVLGRARNGKLVRRAVISGLSRDNWDERWQKRASAA
jgi:hypothetical protein